MEKNREENEILKDISLRKGFEKRFPEAMVVLRGHIDARTQEAPRSYAAGLWLGWQTCWEHYNELRAGEYLNALKQEAKYATFDSRESKEQAEGRVQIDAQNAVGRDGYELLADRISRTAISSLFANHEKHKKNPPCTCGHNRLSHPKDGECVANYVAHSHTSDCTSFNPACRLCEWERIKPFEPRKQVEVTSPEQLRDVITSNKDTDIIFDEPKNVMFPQLNMISRERFRKLMDTPEGKKLYLEWQETLKEKKKAVKEKNQVEEMLNFILSDYSHFKVDVGRNKQDDLPGYEYYSGAIIDETNDTLYAISCRVRTEKTIVGFTIVEFDAHEGDWQQLSAENIWCWMYFMLDKKRGK